MNVELQDDLKPTAFNLCPVSGFFKIWQVDEKTGEKKLLVDQNNMILYAGADILAQALAGKQNSNISNLYVGYNNNGSFSPPVVDKAYSNPFSGYADPFGYLRVPLAYAPTFMADTNFNSNIVVFTSVVTTSSSFIGATFGGGSNIFEVALVAAAEANTSASDRVFSRAQFAPIAYDSNFNLTIAWGIRFLT